MNILVSGAFKFKVHNFTSYTKYLSPKSWKGAVYSLDVNALNRGTYVLKGFAPHSAVKQYRFLYPGQGSYHTVDI
jgi:hypothetical protein